MADLHPLRLATLLDRIGRDLASGGAVLGLDRRHWWAPDGVHDVSWVHFGRRLASPAGPAAGPHTQLAQNLAVAWLAGARFMELKTVQVDDALEIPRPCIHVPNVGFNVEFSQELRVAQSAAEYAKGWLLIHVLARELGLVVDTSFDLSLGYDLDGIQSDKVRGFVAAMRDASCLLDRLRAELPPSLRAYADVEVPAQIADSVTLSTFHGCPADQIEAIAAQLIDWRLHTVVKLNPTLLSYDGCRRMLDHMGYHAIEIDPDDFARDLSWAQLLDMVPRLKQRAAECGVGFGLKLSNTLPVRVEGTPFSTSSAYLSGPPLHPLALSLAARLRAELGPDLPLTFAAGVDAKNFADCVAAGLRPVTACTDLLRNRGYARLSAYVRSLERRMAEAGVTRLADLPPLSLAHLAEAALDDPRYSHPRNRRAPRKVGSRLELFDCLTCDKCVAVCPNLAIFTVALPCGTWSPGRVRWADGELVVEPGETLQITRKLQVVQVADACNLCGQCDVVCPEDGGPQFVKPAFFLDPMAFAEHPERDGFLLNGDRITWRRRGQTYRYGPGRAGEAVLETPTGRLMLAGDRPLSAEGAGEVDLTVAVILRLFRDALRARPAGAWLPMETQE